MTALVILAFVSLALLVFVYFQTRLFTQVIARLVDSLTELKAYALGLPPKEDKPQGFIPPEPSHPDFGLGAIMDEVDKAEGGDDESFDGRA